MSWPGSRLFYPCDEYLSASTRETPTVWRDDDTSEESPAAEAQARWVAAHPDAVKLLCVWLGWCPRCFRPEADHDDARFCSQCGAELLPRRRS